jgi:hypothetical protein
MKDIIHLRTHDYSKNVLKLVHEFRINEGDYLLVPEFNSVGITEDKKIIIAIDPSGGPYLSLYGEFTDTEGDRYKVTNISHRTGEGFIITVKSL